MEEPTTTTENFVPLGFWFNKPPPKLMSPEERFDFLLETDPEFESSFSNITWFLYPVCMNTISISADGILKIEDDQVNKQNTYNIYKDIDYMESAYEKQLRKESRCNMTIYPPIIYLKDYYEMIYDTLVQRDKTGYYDDLILDTNEVVNGYELYKKTKLPIMRKKEYDEFQKLWEINDPYTPEEFASEFDEIACSEWNKVGRDGEYFVKFWKYPEGSDEKTNAWSLTRDDNCQGLWELPYPKSVILKAIKYACDITGMFESVKCINFICEWIKRKTAQMADKQVQIIFRNLHVDDDMPELI